MHLGVTPCGTRSSRTLISARACSRGERSRACATPPRQSCFRPGRRWLPLCLISTSSCPSSTAQMAFSRTCHPSFSQKVTSRRSLSSRARCWTKTQTLFPRTYQTTTSCLPSSSMPSVPTLTRLLLSSNTTSRRCGSLSGRPKTGLALRDRQRDIRAEQRVQACGGNVGRHVVPGAAAGVDKAGSSGGRTDVGLYLHGPERGRRESLSRRYVGVSRSSLLSRLMSPCVLNSQCNMRLRSRMCMARRPSLRRTRRAVLCPVQCSTTGCRSL